MSASIGEPGHETGGWTHAMCDSCWNEKNPDRLVPVRALVDGGAFGGDQCCYCGKAASGIYVRQKATEVHG
jgi:hypothetical protein